jgi:putative acetyltransferase
VKLRACQPQDAPVLAKLFTESVRAIAAADYSPEQLEAWVPNPPDAAYWRERLGALIVFVAEIDSEAAGFISLDRDGHLDHLYVHAGFQRRGVALALYRRIEQEAMARGIRRIFTEASITARPFFARVGFQTIAPQEIERRGVSFTNFRMERLLPASEPDQGPKSA